MLLNTCFPAVHCIPKKKKKSFSPPAAHSASIGGAFRVWAECEAWSRRKRRRERCCLYKLFMEVIQNLMQLPLSSLPVLKGYTENKCVCVCWCLCKCAHVCNSLCFISFNTNNWTSLAYMFFFFFQRCRGATVSFSEICFWLKMYKNVFVFSIYL